jgi:hypothetical protein
MQISENTPSPKVGEEGHEEGPELLRPGPR